MIFRFVLVKVGLFNGLTGSRDAVRKDWVGGSQFEPVFPNRGNRRRSKRGRFCGDPSRLFSAFPVSGDNNGLSGGFLASSLCIQKLHSWRLDFGRQIASTLCSCVVVPCSLAELGN
jgi:hypothetical protein